MAEGNWIGKYNHFHSEVVVESTDVYCYSAMMLIYSDAIDSVVVNGLFVEL